MKDDMVSKYYTPTIDEFHVGFECESNYILVNRNDNNEFITFTFTEDNFAYMVDAYTNDAYPSEFRVKYLDKADIESLGFKPVFHNETDDVEEFNDGFLTINVDFEHHVVDIYRTALLDDPEFYTDYSLDFTIRNKSELKVLLKQLNING